MKTNHDRWIRAAELILRNADLETTELLELVHIETGVPMDLLVDASKWWDTSERYDQRLKKYLGEL